MVGLNSFQFSIRLPLSTFREGRGREKRRYSLVSWKIEKVYFNNHGGPLSQNLEEYIRFHMGLPSEQALSRWFWDGKHVDWWLWPIWWMTSLTIAAVNDYSPEDRITEIWASYSWIKICIPQENVPEQYNSLNHAFPGKKFQGCETDFYSSRSNSKLKPISTPSLAVSGTYLFNCIPETSTIISAWEITF